MLAVHGSLGAKRFSPRERKPSKAGLVASTEAMKVVILFIIVFIVAAFLLQLLPREPAMSIAAVVVLSACMVVLGVLVNEMYRKWSP